MSFVQTSTPPPSMRRQLTEHGEFCMQNNQLRTKTPSELKDNSISPEDFESRLWREPFYNCHRSCSEDCSLLNFTFQW